MSLAMSLAIHTRQYNLFGFWRHRETIGLSVSDCVSRGSQGTAAAAACPTWLNSSTATVCRLRRVNTKTGSKVWWRTTLRELNKSLLVPEFGCAYFVCCHADETLQKNPGRQNAIAQAQAAQAARRKEANAERRKNGWLWFIVCTYRMLSESRVRNIHMSMYSTSISIAWRKWYNNTRICVHVSRKRIQGCLYAWSGGSSTTTKKIDTFERFRTCHIQVAQLMRNIS